MILTVGLKVVALVVPATVVTLVVPANVAAVVFSAFALVFPSTFGAVVLIGCPSVGLGVRCVVGSVMVWTFPANEDDNDVVPVIALLSAVTFTFLVWSPEPFSGAGVVLTLFSHLTKTKSVARVTDSDNS